MADNLKNIISIPTLESSIIYLQAFARVNNDFLPYCKMNITFADGKYQGSRIVTLDDPRLTITQKGIVPLDQLKFGDLAKDFDYTPLKKKPINREISDMIKTTIANKLVQGIHSDTSADFYLSREGEVIRITGYIDLYLENDESIHVPCLYEGENNRFDHYIKRRRILTKEMEPQGGGWIYLGSPSPSGERILDDPFSIKSIYRQFHAEATTLSLIHRNKEIPRDEEIPIEYEQEVNPSDLVLYLALKERGCLALLNRVLPLLSKTKSITYASSTIIQPDGEEEMDGPMIINLEDGRELELDLSKDQYAFLNSEECKNVINSLSEFYQQAQQRYDPLLKIIQEAIKEKQQVALQK